MAHLNEVEVFDAVERQPDAVAAAHLSSCEACSGRVEELRALLRAIEEAGDNLVPEPSPLFWEQFPGRVSRAIDAEPRPAGWLSRWGWWGGAVTAAVVVLLMVLPLRREAVAPVVISPPGDVSAAASGDLATSVPENLDDLLDSFDDDEAWAMVRAVAEETEYEDVEESGLSPRAGSVERAAMELNADERAELARLIEQDARLMNEDPVNQDRANSDANSDANSAMKRTGASLP